MMRGCDVAFVTRYVQRETRSRGYRGPLREVLRGTPLEIGEIQLGAWAHVTPWCWDGERRELERLRLARLWLALACLADYYRAIGSAWDEGRFGDMAIGVEIALQRFAVEEQREERCRRADDWVHGFERAMREVAA